MSTISETTVVSTSEEIPDLHVGEDIVDETSPPASAETPQSHKPNRKPLVTLVANIEYGNRRKVPEKRSYPIYTGTRKSNAPPKKPAPKRILNLQYSLPGESEEEQRSHPIYTTSYAVHSSRAVRAKKKAKEPDELELVRKVYMEDGTLFQRKAKPAGKPDDFVRKVYLAPASGEALPSDSAPKKAADRRRIGVVANFWSMNDSEENLYATKSHRRSAQRPLRPPNYDYQTRKSTNKNWGRKRH